MAPRKETTETERAQMKIMRDEGYSFRHIANRMNLSPNTVYKCVRRHEQNGNFKNTPGRGRKKKLSTSDEKYLKVTSLRNRRKSSKELTRDLEATGSNWQKSVSKTCSKDLDSCRSWRLCSCTQTYAAETQQAQKTNMGPNSENMYACAMEKSYVHR